MMQKFEWRFLDEVKEWFGSICKYCFRRTDVILGHLGRFVRFPITAPEA